MCHVVWLTLCVQISEIVAEDANFSLIKEKTPKKMKRIFSLMRHRQKNERKKTISFCDIFPFSHWPRLDKFIICILSDCFQLLIFKFDYHSDSKLKLILMAFQHYYVSDKNHYDSV